MPEYPQVPEQVKDRTGAWCRRFALLRNADKSYWEEGERFDSFGDALETAMAAKDLNPNMSLFIVPTVMLSELWRALNGGTPSPSGYVANRHFDHFVWQDGQVVVAEHCYGDAL